MNAAPTIFFFINIRHAMNGGNCHSRTPIRVSCSAHHKENLLRRVIRFYVPPWARLLTSFINPASVIVFAFIARAAYLFNNQYRGENNFTPAICSDDDEVSFIMFSASSGQYVALTFSLSVFSKKKKKTRSTRAIHFSNFSIHRAPLIYRYWYFQYVTSLNSFDTSTLRSITRTKGASTRTMWMNRWQLI